MKRTELEKLQGKKLVERMKRQPVAAIGADDLRDKREQRKRDQAAGLLPFAVKLPADLVAALQARAQSGGASLNDLVATLLRDALARDPS